MSGFSVRRLDHVGYRPKSSPVIASRLSSYLITNRLFLYQDSDESSVPIWETLEERPQLPPGIVFPGVSQCAFSARFGVEDSNLREQGQNLSA